MADDRPAARRLIELALDHQALAFGSYTLKSGRPSPYFMNIGMLTSASAAAELGRLYADQVAKLAPAGAVLLGLPYKGIPLAALACAALAAQDPRYRFAYLRKERKEHGEGGLLVGDVDPALPVVLIDDVLTAGTAVAESLAALKAEAVTPAALVVAFDRQERAGDDDRRSAASSIAKRHGLRIASIAQAADLLELATPEQQAGIRAHLQKYGAPAQAQETGTV